MATNETVTIKLMVAADGALRTLDAFDAKMTDAANASVKAGAGVDAYTAQVSRMRAAQEAGIPVLKARAQTLQLEEKALMSVYGKANPLARARMEAERELGRAAAAASNLVVQGKLAESEALRQLAAIETHHAQRVDAAIAGAGKLASANDNLAASYRRVGQSSNFASANVAAQLQDIVVTGQMGMSPLQVALQQGTQLSAALGGQGLTGTVRTLGAAFASLVSPVSLVTMGVIGLGTFAFQSLMKATEGAESANDALKKHSEWLDKVLTGYKDAQDAAAGFIATASTRPEGAVQSDLEAAKLRALKEVDAVLASIAAKEREISTDLQQMGLSRQIHMDTIAASTALQSLGLSARSTNSEIDAVQVQLTRLANNDGASDQARQYARDLLALVDKLDATRTEVDSLDVSLRNLPAQISIGIQLNGLQGVSDAVAQLRAMTPDLRTELEKAEDIVNMNIGQARTTSEINGLVDAYNDLKIAIIEQEVARNSAAVQQQARAFDDEATACERVQSQYEDDEGMREAA